MAELPTLLFILMKILTVLGTRPEIIRLSLIIQKLDALCDHVLVHTGQNFDPNLNDIFFKQLSIRTPDEFLNQERYIRRTNRDHPQ